MYKLDINFSLIIILLLAVVVSFICLKLKIGSLQDKIKKLQKHLIYFNDMIEKHSDKLKNISSTNSDALTTMGPEDSKKSELMEDFDLDLDLDMNDKKDQEQKTDSNTTTSNSHTTTTNNNRTNSSPLTNILPLVSTVMTMMNTNSPQSSFNQQIDHMESPVIEDVTESPSDKNMLLDEIQEELKDLDSSITEQRENSSISDREIST